MPLVSQDQMKARLTNHIPNLLWTEQNSLINLLQIARVEMLLLILFHILTPFHHLHLIDKHAIDLDEKVFCLLTIPYLHQFASLCQPVKLGAVLQEFHRVSIDLVLSAPFRWESSHFFRFSSPFGHEKAIVVDPHIIMPVAQNHFKILRYCHLFHPFCFFI